MEAWRGKHYQAGSLVFILKPAVEIATESRRAQSKWKRRWFSDALSWPRA